MSERTECWICGERDGLTSVQLDARGRCTDRAGCDKRASKLAAYARIFGQNAPVRSPRRGLR